MPLDNIFSLKNMEQIIDCTDRVSIMFNNMKNMYLYWKDLNSECENFKNLLKETNNSGNYDLDIYQRSLDSMSKTFENIKKATEYNKSFVKTIEDPEKRRVALNNELIEMEYMCPVCLEEYCTTKFLFAPCSHHICMECAKKLRKSICPMCKSDMKMCIQYEKAGENLKYTPRYLNSLPESRPPSPDTPFFSQESRPSLLENSLPSQDSSLQELINLAADVNPLPSRRASFDDTEYDYEVASHPYAQNDDDGASIVYSIADSNTTRPNSPINSLHSFMSETRRIYLGTDNASSVSSRNTTTTNSRRRRRSTRNTENSVRRNRNSLRSERLRAFIENDYNVN